jgi:hypothetical protein
MPKSKQKPSQPIKIPLAKEIKKSTQPPSIIFLPLTASCSKISDKLLREYDSEDCYVWLDLASKKTEDARNKLTKQLQKRGNDNVNKLRIMAPYKRNGKNENKWTWIEEILCGNPIFGWKPSQVIIYADAIEPISMLIEEKYEDNIELSSYTFVKGGLIE